jgi:hypothetical protein
MNMFMFDAELVNLLSMERRFGGRTRMRGNAPRGRRERNKEDKLRRIKQAARKLFVANGYDEASTRQFATRAGVALGTLFLYAANKRHLLFLAVNDELEARSGASPVVTISNDCCSCPIPSIVRIAQEKGEIGTKNDARKVGTVIFAIFQIEIRRWLTSRKVVVEAR